MAQQSIWAWVFKIFFFTQGISHIETIQEYLHSKCMTGSLLWSTLEWAQIHIGIDQNLFSLDYEKYKHLLPKSFIKTAWEFASLYNIQLSTNIPSLSQHREGDQFLMQAFGDIQDPIPFTSSELETLNSCRLYLNVTTLSDIVDGSGTRICKRATDGIRDTDLPSNHQWPNQASPGPTQWTLWRKAITRCFPLNDQKELYPFGKMDG